MPRGVCFGDGRDALAFVEAHLGEPRGPVKILNHRGLLSLKVETGEGLFKVAECESPERAALAEKALAIVAGANGPVPGFLIRSGSVIVCHWVHGEPCSKVVPELKVRFAMDCQEALSKTALPDPENIPARYVHLESLLARFLRVSTRIIPRARARSVVDGLRERLPALASPGIIHPDLTPANIIIAEDGPVIIDNEAIAIGAGCEFDVWNTGEAICGHRDHAGIERYARQFHERCPMPTLFEYQSLWDDFRRLRRAMKAMEKMRLIKARRLVRQIDE